MKIISFLNFDLFIWIWKVTFEHSFQNIQA